jgi:hypothetical protein
MAPGRNAASSVDLQATLQSTLWSAFLGTREGVTGVPLELSWRAAGARLRACGESVGCSRGRFTKVTDRKLFVIERQEHRSAPRQINRADPAEALRSSPDASVSGGSPSCCCLALMPLVCETTSSTSNTLGRQSNRRIERHPRRRNVCPLSPLHSRARAPSQDKAIASVMRSLRIVGLEGVRLTV